MTLKAFLVGINEYPGAADRLRGCVNDVTRMREVLSARYHLAENRLRVCCDAEATRDAILAGLRWLAEPDVDDPAPTRLFHFSGHGMLAPDADGDEEDGTDECLAPYDYAAVGPLPDDQLREAYRSFGPQLHLLLVMDCCHSGTISRDSANDIMYRFLPQAARKQAIDAARATNAAARETFVQASMRDLNLGGRTNVAEFRQRRQQALDTFAKQRYGLDTLEGNIVLLAACAADQKAADAHFGDVYSGALTYHLTEVLRQASQPLSYATLIDQASLGISAGTLVQTPQLECSQANRQRMFLNPTL